MVGCMGVLDNARRGPKTGGDVVRDHIAQAAGGEDPYVFSYRRLDVMSRDVVLAPARNDTVPIQEVSVQTACH